MFDPFLRVPYTFIQVYPTVSKDHFPILLLAMNCHENSLVGEIWLTKIHINIPLTYRSSLVPLLPTPPWGPRFGWYRTRPACLRAGRSHCNHRPVMRTDAFWNFGSSMKFLWEVHSWFCHSDALQASKAYKTNTEARGWDPLKFACCVPRNGVTLFVDQQQFNRSENVYAHQNPSRG